MTDCIGDIFSQIWISTYPAHLGYAYVAVE